MCAWETRAAACRQELVDAAAAAVGGVWEAAAGCNAGQTYLPLLVQGYLKARCTFAPGAPIQVQSELNSLNSTVGTRLERCE